jgi:hypothetical protein
VRAPARWESLQSLTVTTQQAAVKSLKPCPHINLNKTNKASYTAQQWLRLIYRPAYPFEFEFIYFP